MKKQLNIFLGTIFILTSILIGCFNSDDKKANIVTTTKDINDTTFLKAIKWNHLNTYVDYHILRGGNTTIDTNLHFIVKPIAVYQYFQNKFELLNDSTMLTCNVHELKDIILSDSFSDRTNFECLLKINSQIGYHYRPDLLKTVTVILKDTSNKIRKGLMTDLKKEIFTDRVTYKIKKDTFFLNKPTETIFININLKPMFWDLKKLNEVCSILNKRLYVDTAFFNDLLTGLNENEAIYLLTDK